MVDFIQYIGYHLTIKLFLEEKYMKFCTNCNAQLEDNAVFCSACGTQQPVVEEAPVEVAPAPAKEKLGIVGLFSFIGDIMAILSAFFSVAAILVANIDVNVYTSSYLSSGIRAYAYLETGAGCGVFALLFSFGVIGSGVLSLIASLKKREGVKALFANIKKLTLGSFLLILSIIVLAHI
jgi:hypothetical protein